MVCQEAVNELTHGICPVEAGTDETELGGIEKAVMGILGMNSSGAGVASSAMFVTFAVMWALNGWSQSMGAAPAIISLSRWFPLNIRGTFYGFFSASHNFGEGLSFVFVSLLVSAAGWQWGFFGAAIAGAVSAIALRNLR